MSEIIDVYDRHKKKLPFQVQRNTYEFNSNEYMMYVLAILENKEGKYLITRRSFQKKWAAGDWEMPGGGAKSNESSMQAITREVKEETNLDVQNGKIVYSYFNEDEKKHDNYFVDIYHFKFDFSLNDVILRQKESIECRLVTLNELILLNKERPFLHFERIMEALQQKK